MLRERARQGTLSGGTICVSALLQGSMHVGQPDLGNNEHTWP